MKEIININSIGQEAPNILLIPDANNKMFTNRILNDFKDTHNIYLILS